jgi:hypothetical protein
MSSKRFRIALSFPGKYREIIEKIAEKLSLHYSAEQILYDHYHRAEFARPNLDTYLQKLYHDESDLIVVCLCGEYKEREWCGLEWRAIRDLLNQKMNDLIMFIRVDDGDVDGIFGTVDGDIKVTKYNINEVSNAIIQRHNML